MLLFIIKKYILILFLSKIFKTDRGSDWFKAYVETAIFNTTKKVDLLISEVENLFTNKLENGNRQRAMKRLRVPPFEEKVSFYGIFELLKLSFRKTIWSIAKFLDNISPWSLHWNDIYSCALSHIIM